MTGSAEMPLPPIFVRMIVHRAVESSRLCLPGHDLRLLSAVRSKRPYLRAPAVTDGPALPGAGKNSGKTSFRRGRGLAKAAFMGY